MLNKEDLSRYKSHLNFNIGQLEKDYLQHLFLLFLSRNIKDELIFKGGTALQKAYSLNRFSEDLDFTLLKEMNLDILIKRISKDISDFGFETRFEKLEGRGRNYRIRIKGPLYDGTENTIASLRIEISLRKDLILKPDTKEIVPVYTDTQPYLILIMNTQEILAEKARAVLQRGKARDVYDIWFLLKKGVKPNYKLIEKKSEMLNLKFSRNIFINSIKNIRQVWEKELSGYLSIIPDFKNVFKEIKEYFSRV